MKPRITLITLGVDDLEAAVRFYRDGLGLKTEGIIGREFEHGAIAFFELQGGLKLDLWPRASIAFDSGLPLGPCNVTEFTIADNVNSAQEVDAVLAQASAAGAEIVKPGHATAWGATRAISGTWMARLGSDLEPGLAAAGLNGVGNRQINVSRRSAYDAPVRKPKTSPRVVIFAGPNGAGKSTHADAILAALGIETFVNADYIARGLSGANTESVAFEAGRIMLRRLHYLAEAEQDFAFESTLSSRTFAPFLRNLKLRGYRIAIHYFSLSSASLAVRRVKLRVAMGGHAVPAEVVKRRFGRSVNNFFRLYAPLADDWMVYDNTAHATAELLAEFNGNEVIVKRPQAWKKLQRLLSVH